MARVRACTARRLAAAGIAMGLLCIGYGYAFHRTTLVVQAEAEPDEAGPEDVVLPPGGEWDDDGAEEPLPQDEEWDDETLEPEEDGPAPQKTVVATEWELVKGAVQGIVERLTDGRLALTWIGKPGEAPPACPT